MTTLPVRPSGRSASEVSKIMSRVRSQGTEPEKLLGNALRRAGIRSFRLYDSSLPGKPDIAVLAKDAADFAARIFLS
jgi:G:T-mismatch repair DNA endonuclease (very short patch repair protein)